MRKLRLVSDRLVITYLSSKDIKDNYLLALNDDSIIGLTEARHKKWDRHSAKEFIDNANNQSSRLFKVKLKTESKIIGNVRLFNINLNNEHAELSFLFYDK